LSLDPVHYPPAPALHPAPPVAGIVGTGSWLPTARAMRRLVGNVWPRILPRVGDAHLVGAGRDLAAAGPHPAERVELRGEVDSAADFLRALTVLVYPLGVGSGMKVKVLEALACGVPVVTTRAGAEGIVANDGVVVAEDDDEIASATIAILNDPDER